MIGIMSDIHGNYEALKAVLNFFDANSISEIYCLGDVVGYYSQVNECCDELRKRNIQCVMGNHDWYMAAGSFCPRSRSVNDCLGYQRTIISKENLEWIRKFPLYICRDSWFMVHGGWSDPIDEYIKEPSEEYFARLPQGYYFSGHTHVQQLCQFKNNIYCNPGAVGQPRDADCRAACVVFDGRDIELIRLEYDIEKVVNLMEHCGFSGYYYECLFVGGKNLGFIHDRTKEMEKNHGDSRLS